MPWTFYSALGQKLNTLATAGGASALQVNDSVAVALGTGSDSKIYYDGTDSHWDLRDTGTGDLIIAQEACHPSPDPGQVHLWAGSAGSVTATTTSQLTIEDNTNTGISILTPACAFGAVYFGDPGSNIAGGLLYNHGACRLCVRVEGNNVYWIKAAAMGFPNGAACAPSITFTGDTNTGLYHTNTADTLELIAGGGGSIRLDSDSKVFIKETANGNMGRGLTIQQGGYDNEILALKSSDVGHGMTAYAEADTYGFLKKLYPCQGGLSVSGFSTAACKSGLDLYAASCGAANTTKGTSALGIIQMRSEIRNTNNSSTTNAATDSNMVVMRNGDGQTRFIFDNEGSGHADVEWTTYSDGRLKSNRAEVPYGLDTLMQLRPQIYCRDSGYLDEGNPVLEGTPYRHIGFIAQEVKALVPEIIDDVCEGKSWYSLNDGKLTAVVVKADQELEARVTALEGK